jgi:WD40 repeat protein
MTSETAVAIVIAGGLLLWIALLNGIRAWFRRGLTGLRPRYSLRTLVLGQLAAVAVVGFWLKKDPAWELERVLEGHFGAVYSACFSPDGHRILTASSDETSRLWDARTGQCLLVIAGPGVSATRAQFTADGSGVLTSSMYEQGSRLWSATDGSELDFPEELAVVRPPTGYEGFLERRELVPGDALGGRQGVVAVTDPGSGRIVARLEGHEWGAHAAAYSGDRRRIVTGAGDHRARIWRRRRPEAWWGVLWRWEFWLASMFCLSLALSVRDDRRRIGRRAR